MHQTKSILKVLQDQYLNIDHYYNIIEVIEEHSETNPDIAIESCKALIEGISKFILKQLDQNFNVDTVDSLKLTALFKSSCEIIAK